MKKCPHCQKTAISFVEWGQGVNAFRTRCRSCGAKLKATPATYWAALVCFVVILGLIFLLAPWAESEGIRRYTFQHVIIAGIAVAVCGLAYRFCGYDRAE